MSDPDPNEPTHVRADQLAQLAQVPLRSTKIWLGFTIVSAVVGTALAFLSGQWLAIPWALVACVSAQGQLMAVRRWEAWRSIAMRQAVLLDALMPWSDDTP
jgi:hypothetical protein